MAKKKQKGSRKNRFTLSLATVAPMTLLATDVIKSVRDVDTRAGLDMLIQRTTGYSPYERNWEFDRLKYYVLPQMVGVMAHKVANKIGINRAIARAGIPWVRI